GWQRTWDSITYVGIMTVPTACFLMSVQLTGYWRRHVAKLKPWLLVIPAVLFVIMLTDDYHHLFFVGSEMLDWGSYVEYETSFGPLFYVHTAYSYLLLLTGLGLLAISLITNYRRYGAQAYGIILGILA